MIKYPLPWQDPYSVSGAVTEHPVAPATDVVPLQDMYGVPSVQLVVTVVPLLTDPAAGEKDSPVKDGGQVVAPELVLDPVKAFQAVQDVPVTAVQAHHI